MPDCIGCAKEFYPTKVNQKYCSRQCKVEAYQRQNGKQSIRKSNGLAPSTVGAIGELEVCLDLLEKGYQVFRAISPACHCDIVAYKDGHPIRVEVKTGYRKLSGEVIFPKFSVEMRKRFDYLAVVCPDGIIYDPVIVEH